MPVIEFPDGRKFNCAMAVMHYLGMITGTYPNDPTIAYDNDRITEDFNDMLFDMDKVFYKKNDQDRIDTAKITF